jgi:hypothetical protein
MNWERCFIGMGLKVDEPNMSASAIRCIGEYDGNVETELDKFDKSV